MEALKTRPTIVVDTNVWISGLVFGGKPKQVIEMVIDGSVSLIVSEELLTELRRKVLQRFPAFAPQLSALEALICERAYMVQLGTILTNYSRDHDDDKFVETAIIGEAGFIISGDKDLLDMKIYNGIKILRPAEFLAKQGMI